MGAQRRVRRRALGICLIAVGTVLIAVSVAALFSYGYQEERAEENTRLVLSELKQELTKREESAIYEPVSTEEPPAGALQQITWSGYDLVGMVRIPALALELPVMSTWDYGLLQMAPCRYSGSVDGGDLILMAHNYKNHFGRLKELEQGAAVEFEDVDGTVYVYEVTATEILKKTESDRLASSDCELTLFTCTQGGYSRYVVRCSLSELR